MGKHYAVHIVHELWTSGGMRVLDRVHHEGVWVLSIVATDLTMDG